MRQPDENRVRKALSHIQAARTVLASIKWENLTMMEDQMRQQAFFNMETVDSYLKDMLNVSKP